MFSSQFVKNEQLIIIDLNENQAFRLGASKD